MTTTSAVMPTVSGPPAVHRIKDAVRYHWNNTAHPLPRALRRTWDARMDLRSAVRSDDSRFDVSMVYAGLPLGHLNVLRLMERQRARLGGEKATVRPVRTSWDDLVAGHLPDADLVFVGAEEARIRRLPAERAFIAPFRVHLVVDTTGGPDTVSARISRRERWEFGRNNRRRDWSLEEDDSPEALRFFFDRMHLPTMRVRHAEQIRTESFTVARDQILRHGRLLFLTEGGRRTAGALCRMDGDVLTTRLLGVLDGDEEHYASGAFKALYHLLLRMAAERGLSGVDLYGTEAFIAKGIFQWKRRLAPRIELPPNHFSSKRLYISVRRDTGRIRDFLVANPFLEIDESSAMRPVYFYDATRPARTDISAKAGSLGEPRMVDLDALFAESRSDRGG
jgi:Acetyltransferase (GNAT) domain